LLGSGDNVILLNPQANDIMDEVYWGSALPHSKKGKKLVKPFTLRGDSIAGPIAQSVTRSPEVVGLWALHKTVSSTGLPYSPGSAAGPVTPVFDQTTSPRQYALKQNYPNPFNPTTSFEFQVSSYELVTLRVSDLLGREVATLVNVAKSPGSYIVRWNAGGLPSGVYFYQLRAGSFVETRKLLLTK
jgi:hypothetical protein